MPDNRPKHRWTRTEKWLIATPLLVLLCFFGMTTGKEIARRKMGLPITVIPQADSLHGLALSPDGMTVALSRELTSNEVRLYDTRTGNLCKIFHANLSRDRSGSTRITPADALAFSPDGRMLARGSAYGLIELFNVATCQQVNVIRAPAAHLAFSPNGRWIASDKGRIFDAHTGKLHKKIPLAVSGHPIRFSPDGRFLATSEGNLQKWARTSSLKGWVASAAKGSIQLWSVQTGHLVRTIAPSFAYNIAYSPDGKMLAALQEVNWAEGQHYYNGSQVRMLDLAKGTVLWKSPNEFGIRRGDIAFSPNGRFLAVLRTDDSVELHRSDDGTVVAVLRRAPKIRLTTKKPYSGFSMYSGLAFSFNGKVLAARASSRDDDEIRIWNMDEVNAQFAPR